MSGRQRSSGLVVKGRKLYASYHRDGRRVRLSTGYAVGDEAKAHAVVAEIQRQIALGTFDHADSRAARIALLGPDRRGRPPKPRRAPWWPRWCECGKPTVPRPAPQGRLSITTERPTCAPCRELDGKAGLGELISALRVLGGSATLEALVDEMGRSDRSIRRWLVLGQRLGRVKRIASNGDGIGPAREDAPQRCGPTVPTFVLCEPRARVSSDSDASDDADGGSTDSLNGAEAAR